MWVLIFPLFFALGTSDLLVRVSNGVLNGTSSLDMNGKRFHSFWSIPFAQPPVNKLRYKDPLPAGNWSEVRDATKKPPLCFQKTMTGQFAGGDDCLYLNVHTPNLNGTTLKPVIVYIHGGGFIEGTSGDWGPEFLVAEDVLFVTMNYRLGVMGFLNFDDPEVGVPGNAGFKDQVLAMKWVQKEIHHFGGDPKQVTILGESAGSCSVHLHVLSPMSQGLFQKAAALSGTALAAWAYGVKDSGVLYAKELGFQGDNPKEMLEFMQNANRSVLEYTMRNVTLLMPVATRNIFGPTIESKDSKQAFLPDTARNLLRAGNFSKVPMIMGTTSKEGMLLDLFAYINSNKPGEWPLEFFLPYYLLEKLNSTQLEKIKGELKNFYFSNNASKSEQVIKLATDAFFTNGLHESLLGHSLLNQPLYFYQFESDTQMNLYKRFHPVTANFSGACHGDDLGYLFKTVYGPAVEKGSIEDKSIRLMARLHANFAKTGKPTGLKTVALTGLTTWRKMNLGLWNNINIMNDKLTASCRKLMPSYTFWCDLYKKYGSPVHHFCLN